MSLITWQDFTAQKDAARAVAAVISQHKASEAYITAADADAYDRQRNTTINNYAKTIFTAAGVPVADITASNNRLASNFFRRLNTQRNTYSLGNGVTFPEDGIKKKLGGDFDTQLSADTPGDIAETLKGNIQRRMAERDRLMLYITAIPDSLTRQAFMLRFAEGLTWAQTAASIGGGNSGAAIRHRAQRYVEKNPLAQ